MLERCSTIDAQREREIYIYIEREREREMYIYIYVYIHICVYIYIYYTSRCRGSDRQMYVGGLNSCRNANGSEDELLRQQQANVACKPLWMISCCLLQHLKWWYQIPILPNHQTLGRCTETGFRGRDALQPSYGKRTRKI